MIKRVSGILSFVVALTGILVIIGWTFDIPIFKTIFPKYGSMKVNTAICFILSGITLWIINRKGKLSSPEKIISTVFSILISVIGIVTIIEYKYQIGFSIDELFFKDNTTINQSSSPGQMSPITAFNFICLGFALLFLQNQKYFRVYQVLSLIVFSIGLTTTIGYIYQIDWLTTLPSSARTSIHTCLSFLMISVGILFTYPEKGIMEVFESNTVSGKMIRILIPVYIITLLLLGWFRLYFTGVNARTGLAAFVYLNIIFFIALIFLATYYMNRVEKKQIEIKEQLALSEQKFRTLFAAAPDAVILINDKGFITGWNLQADRK